MVDYMDGNWHPWLGGECPVDQDAEIEVLMVHWFNRPKTVTGKPGYWMRECWQHGHKKSAQIVALRFLGGTERHEVIIDGIHYEPVV